jgi:hypothetical protein
LSARATIFRLSGSDFAFKLDIDGLIPRDGLALSRNIANARGHGVVVIDGSNPDPVSSILFSPNAPDAHGHVEDAEPNGIWFRINGTAAE